MKVIVRKPDLDTCLTALILGVGEQDEIVIAPEGATAAELADPTVLCLEAGGSGTPEWGNFDHHDPGKSHPPACRQAYEHLKLTDAALERLVAYVSMVDENPTGHPPISFPSLSNLFSGMMLVEIDPQRCFRRGLELLKEVWKDGIDPFAPMPDRPHWRCWREAKKANRRKMKMLRDQVYVFTTRRGKSAGFLTSGVIGGVGLIYSRGCDIAVLYHPAFGLPPVPKYTIGGKNVAVSPLLDPLNTLEAGWGGRETIIGSPATGSRLAPETVIALIKRCL
ncbi:MAG: hypothetical protein N2Z74_04250 [Syntrophales bacterium]|nr:hypothetical protein [Syntrophales bacterium]